MTDFLYVVSFSYLSYLLDILDIVSMFSVELLFMLMFGPLSAYVYFSLYFILCWLSFSFSFS